MRILHVSERIAPLGGCERMLLDTCRLSQVSGHQTCIVVADDTASENAPVPVFGLPRSRGPRGAHRVRPALESLLAELRPDVVHLHNVQGFLSPLLLDFLRKRRPTVRYVHDTRLVCPRYLSKLLARSGHPCSYPMGTRCLLHCYPIETGPGTHLGMLGFGLRRMELSATRRLDAILVGSEYMRRQLLANGFHEGRLHLLPGFTDKSPGEPPAQSGEPRVLAVGRFDEVKGLEALPDLLSRLRTPGWRATIVGDGPGLDRVRERARELGLAHRVQFAGRISQDEIDVHYRQAAILVVPSRIPEAFGLVGVEAMAFARPVVAHDIGGIREWLQDEVTGFLVRPGEWSAFAERIDLLLGDRSRAERMGRDARASVDARFRPQHYLDRLFGIYASVVAARSGPPAAGVAGNG